MVTEAQLVTVCNILNKLMTISRLPHRTETTINRSTFEIDLQHRQIFMQKVTNFSILVSLV